MKRLIIFICIIMAAELVIAQETVHLRNGSVIKGTVTDDNENNKVSIKTRDGNVLVYDMGEVLNITCDCKSFDQSIFLKNGSIVKGCVAERKPNQSVTIRTKDGNVLNYSIDELVPKPKIEPSMNKTARITTSATPTSSNLYTGYRGFADIAFHYLGSIDYGAMFSTVHGGYVLPYLYVGGGASFGFRTKQNDFNIGYNWSRYHWDYGFQISIPLFLNLRGYYPLKSGGGGPFIDGRVGFHVINIGINCNTSASFFTCLALGWSWNAGKNAWNFSMGWQYENESYYGEINQWVIRFGYEF